jgi:hypothetical protein
MDEETLKGLLFNVLCDLRKKELTVVEKGQIVKEYIDKEKISINEASRRLAIPKTTIHTWARAELLGEDKYKELLEAGYTATEIQNKLKNGNGEARKILEKKRIDVLLDEAKSNLAHYITHKDYSHVTQIKIQELQNVLNRILMRINT